MRRIAVLIVAALAMAVAGCGAGPDESREDAHDTQNVDKTSPEAIAFNNHYPNVETKCNHGHRIYVATQGSFKFQVIPNDPSCPGARGQ